MREEHRATAADVQLDRLSPNEWRVCDRSFGEDDHLSILGIIEEIDGGFEVTRMSAPGTRETFDSLYHARESFALFPPRRIHSAKTVV